MKQTRQEADVCVGGLVKDTQVTREPPLLCASQPPQAAATDRSRLHPFLSAVTTGSLKCHPQGPKDVCRHVIGSAGQSGCYAEVRLSEKLIFTHVSRGRGDTFMAGRLGDLSHVS